MVYVGIHSSFERQTNEHPADVKNVSVNLFELLKRLSSLQDNRRLQPYAIEPDEEKTWKKRERNGRSLRGNHSRGDLPSS